ncbi:MAG: hypothetical protein L0Y79_00060 [Chlorobi bacterium]|nr:hypothetical protein [Chlorobiota bacterium]MCI0716527.1 hypothetical protein [Chlorobiota bacterium]
MKIIIKIFYGISIIGVFFAIDWFLAAMKSSSSAPQQAAGSAIALCYVVIPYCLARAIEKIIGDIKLKRKNNESALPMG